jgi:hypothetical protein
MTRPQFGVDPPPHRKNAMLVIDHGAPKADRQAEGVARRDDILPVVEARDVPWRLEARRWVLGHPVGFEFDADDLTDGIGDPPSAGTPGAVINGMARSGLIKSVGWVKSARPHSNASQVQRWRLL